MKNLNNKLMVACMCVYLLAAANLAFAAIDSDGGRTNPVTLTFILAVGLIFGLVVFFICRQIRLYFYQRAVVMNRQSPKESLQKYWGRSSFVWFSILSLFFGLSLCFLLIWILERDAI